MRKRRRRGGRIRGSFVEEEVGRSRGNASFEEDMNWNEKKLGGGGKRVTEKKDEDEEQ